MSRDPREKRAAPQECHQEKERGGPSVYEEKSRQKREKGRKLAIVSQLAKLKGHSPDALGKKGKNTGEMLKNRKSEE